ncbi:MAG: methyl-accepting chemotaxis protein [Phenylobacterium sp.]|jgi:methyl-accepting chemotaxis protein
MSEHDLLYRDKLDIDSEQQRIRKAYLCFEREDALLLQSLEPMVRQHADSMVDQFYANLNNFPEAQILVEQSGSSVDSLKRAQRKYLLELFQGDYGDSYFDGRCRIGQVHARIGLTPRWYLGAYSVYLDNLIPLVCSKFRFKPRKLNQALSALNKILLLDQQLVMDTYISGLTGQLDQTRQSLELKVDKYSNFIHNVAGGQLTERLDTEGDDSLALLGERLNEMVERLSLMVQQMKTSSEDTMSTLEDLTHSVNIQSTGAAEQATAVNETTTTLSQIKATSYQTLEKAKRLSEISERSREESEQSLNAMQESINSLFDIKDKVQGIAQTILALSQQTQQIGEITEVVTGLAQQLKMLALNASIEAAKAGEAGKGFGVVAAEVKELAEQSQQSTAQVQKILQDISHATDRAVMASEEGGKGVEDGTRLMEKTGGTINKLFNVIKETNLASQQIVAAVGQEAVGIQQVSIAMNQINDVTVQFVDSSNNTDEATEKLRQNATKLANSIDVYTVIDRRKQHGPES